MECEHLRAWKAARGGVSAYRPVQRSLKTLWADKQAAKHGVRPQAMVCLHCAATSRDLKTHSCQHAHQTGHQLALDVQRSELFCCACQDYIYDPDFDSCSLGAAAAMKPSAKGGSGREVQITEPDHRKRRPSEEAGSEAPAPKKARAVQRAHGLPYGLRGLSNLGNTCFMNSVLQALLHSPLLRNFYLSGSHPYAQCTHHQSKPCLSCELDGVFSAAYSGASQPFSPAAFLYAWWCHADHHLAGYQQQDAHEFYLFALSGLSQSRLPGCPPDRASGQTGYPASLPKNGVAAWKSDRDEQSSQGWQVPVKDFTDFTDPASIDLNGASRPRFMVPDMNGTHGLARAPGMKLEAGVKPEEAGIQLGCAVGKLEEGGDGAEASHRERSSPAVASTSSDGAEDGKGIVQRVFGGVLQSDVICCACGHTSTAHDPFLDISLDIKAPPIPPPPLLRPPAAAGRQAGQPRRLSGAAAMAVAAAQKRAARATSAPVSTAISEVSTPAVTAATGLLDPAEDVFGQTQARLGLASHAEAGAEAGAGLRPPSAELTRASPEDTAASTIGEAASAVPGEDTIVDAVAQSDSNDDSVDLVGLHSAGRQSPAVSSPMVDPPGDWVIGAVTRHGSSEADAPEGCRSSIPDPSAARASNNRGALCSEGASSGVVGDSQGAQEEILSPPSGLGHAAALPQRKLPQTRVPAAVSSAKPEQQQSAAQPYIAPAAQRAPMQAAPQRKRPASAKKPRPTRCMKCATCLRPSLKKACLRNKALRNSGVPLDDGAWAGGLDALPYQETLCNVLQPGNGALDRVRAEEDAAGASSRSPSGGFGFATRGSLPLPPMPRGLGSPGRPQPPLVPPSLAAAAAAARQHPAPRQQPQPQPLMAAVQARETPPPSHPISSTEEILGATAGDLPPSAPPPQRQPGPASFGAISLLGCLHRFVRPESLGAGEHWTCERCKLQQRAVKQMSIRHLPPVLCLHVKRFEHLGVGKKLHTPLLFSAHLDMRPFLSSTVLQNRFAAKRASYNSRSGTAATDASGKDRGAAAVSEAGSVYELYAVGGHYVAYIKCGESWYLCDDGFVLEVDEATACAPNAYMLYYRQARV